RAGAPLHSCTRACDRVRVLDRRHSGAYVVSRRRRPHPAPPHRRHPRTSGRGHRAERERELHVPRRRDGATCGAGRRIPCPRAAADAARGRRRRVAGHVHLEREQGRGRDEGDEPDALRRSRGREPRLRLGTGSARAAREGGGFPIPGGERRRHEDRTVAAVPEAVRGARPRYRAGRDHRTHQSRVGDDRQGDERRRAAVPASRRLHQTADLRGAEAGGHRCRRSTYRNGGSRAARARRSGDRCDRRGSRSPAGPDRAPRGPHDDRRRGCVHAVRRAAGDRRRPNDAQDERRRARRCGHAERRAETEKYTSRVVGRSTEPLINTREETGFGNLITDSFVEYGLQQGWKTDVAFYNMAGVRASFPAGQLTYGQLYEALPFSNTVVNVDLAGADLAAIIDRAACVNGRLHMAGVVVSFRFDNGLPNCVKSITVGGAPLAPTRTYHVATIDYLLLGGDGHTGFAKGTNVIYGDVEVDVVAAYITAHSPVSPKVEGRLASS